MSSEHHVVGPGLHEVLAAINFIIVAAILFFAAKGGVITGLKSRAESIAKKLRDSKSELGRVETQLAGVKKELANFEQSRVKILAEIKQEGESLSRSLVEEAARNAERLLTDAKLTVQTETQNAIETLKGRIVKEALAEAQDVLSRSDENKASVHKQLFENLTFDLKGADLNGR